MPHDRDAAAAAAAAQFVFCYIGLRCTLSAYTCYVSYHVVRARKLLSRELAVLVMALPLGIVVSLHRVSAYDPVFWPLWLAAIVIDFSTLQARS